MGTINAELKNSPNKKGECKIRIRMQTGKDRKFQTTAFRVHPDFWDAENKVIKSNHPKARDWNKLIKIRIDELQLKMDKSEMIDHEIDLNKVAGFKVTKTSFRKFVAERMAEWAKWKELSTMRGLNSNFKALNSFAPALMIEDVTPEFLSLYVDHCRIRCKSSGSIKKRLDFVSTVINEAIRKGIITVSPFLTYKRPKVEQPVKTWLTADEVDAFEAVLNKPFPRFRENEQLLKSVGWWFLFSCYTGLRWSDVQRFDPNLHIIDNRLVMKTKKKKIIVSIWMTSDIKRIMEKAIVSCEMPSNRHCNVYVRRIAGHAGIKKYVTFHTGRHTFACGCANRSISMEVTKELLGHTDLKSTAVYYKITNTRIDKEMQNWERSADNAVIVNMKAAKKKAM